MFGARDPWQSVKADAVVAKLDAAPLDDEELTDEDRQMIRKSREEPGIAWPEAESKLSSD